MTGSVRRLPWSPVAPIPSATPGGFSMGRRTLYRALAVALALAAITPLFADSASIPDQGNPQSRITPPADSLSR